LASRKPEGRDEKAGQGDCRPRAKKLLIESHMESGSSEQGRMLLPSRVNQMVKVYGSKTFSSSAIEL
jgi:hypothetical protein